MSSINKRSTRVAATFKKQTLSRSSLMMLCHDCFLSYRVYKMDPSLSPRLANADHLEGKKLTIKKNERILGKFTSTPFASEHAIISISLSLFQSLSHSRARTHALTLSRLCTHSLSLGLAHTHTQSLYLSFTHVVRSLWLSGVMGIVQCRKRAPSCQISIF